MATRKITGLTIKFGADTTPLDKALKDVNKNSKDLNTELKQVNRLLKFDPKNTTLLAQKQKILADSIGNTEKKLDGLKQAQGEVERMFKNGDIGDKEYRDFQRTLAETEQSLKSYQGQLKKTEDAHDASVSKLSKVGGALKKAGGKTVDAGKALLPISGAVAALGVASGVMAMDFETAIAKVSTIADTTKVPLADLSNSIRDLSDETGISAVQIADSVYNAISAGQDTGDAVDFVRSSTKLAKAGFADAGDALDILTSIMNAYGMEAEEVEKISDTLIQTQNMGKTTVGELSTAMGKVIPSAKANSVALDQVATGYAIMTSNGVKTAESTTYMNRMLNELGKSGTKVSDTLKEKTGKSFQQLMEEGASLGDVLQIVSDAAGEQSVSFSDMWGSSEAAKAGLILLGDGADEFNGKLGDMKNSAGATDEAFKKIQTQGGELKKIMQQAKNILIDFGSAIMTAMAPIIKEIAKVVKSFSDWFSGLSEGGKKFMVLAGIIVALAAPILILAGNIMILAGSIMSLNVPLLPLIGIIAAIIIVIIGVIAIVKNWGAVTDWLSEKFTVFKEFLAGVWDSISEKTKAVWDGIKGFFTELWGGIWGTITTVWNSITGFLGGVWDGIKDKAISAFTTVWDFIKKGFDSFGKTLSGIIKGIANGIISPIAGAVNGVINGVNWVLDKVGSKTQFDLWDAPKFAKGTGGLRKDTLGVVNDQKGATYKEMIVPPNGRPYIPEGRDVVLPLKKGTKIMPAKETAEFLKGLPHFAGGIGDFFGGVWDTVKDFTGNVWDYMTNPSKIVKLAIDKFANLVDIVEPWFSVAKGAVNSVFDGVVDFVKGIFETESKANYNASAGVEQWRGLAEKALRMTGQFSEANLERLLYQMQTESGGNPNAINDWDINAINGTPSKGLMQVIDPTFRAHAYPGYSSNVWDPLSNMLASIRYAVSRYGSLAAAYKGTGYEKGIGRIDLSDLLPSLPSLDVRWFKEGGILTKPTLFNLGGGRIGGAGEDGAEAIAPIKKLKEYITDAVQDVLGSKDINLIVNLSSVLDGAVVAQKTVRHTRPLLEEMDNFQKMRRGERI